MIAPFGQASSHAPQSRHSFSSTTATSSSLREIAAAGHSSIQLPQPVQASASTFATMFFTPYTEMGTFIESKIYKVDILGDNNLIKSCRFRSQKQRKKQIKDNLNYVLPYFPVIRINEHIKFINMATATTGT